MNHVDRDLNPSGPGEDFYPTLSWVKCVPLSCMSVLWQAGGSTGLLMDLAANEKAVHSDFFNGKMSSCTHDLPWLIPLHLTNSHSQQQTT